MLKSVSQLAILTLACLSFTLIGCGGSSGPKPPAGPKGTVMAKVTCDGKPVTTGTLLLQSDSGFAASANAGPDGLFELKGPFGAELPVGKYKVSISPGSAPAPPIGATEMPKPPTIDGVPSKFYNPVTSKVVVEVKEGAQELTIDLK